MQAAAALLAVLGLACSAPSAHAAPGPRARVVTCSGFMDGFLQAAAGKKASFERPLNITRGFFGDEAGLEVRILNDGEDVDGTLKCRGDTFRRFELRIGKPDSDKLVADFNAFQAAALTAAFGWERAKVATVSGALNSDAAEYLRASIQRGDTYLSGKVEYHQGDALDLGVIWTPEDRMLVITTQDDG